MFFKNVNLFCKIAVGCAFKFINDLTFSIAYGTLSFQIFHLKNRGMKII
ncbi:hypothetical protein MTBBW1_2200039 [Desulfamplus magnetovallimortis]|uniref:Uncharacterized protein n=1 Tax=Desulfamplus magnetovallimortis TaxID=1246637 RepID=A0A1W1HDD4_9BACT|nr:hypothetical protein MTBBW1_2200039 [Desulfamplus magnetovallimortis]